MTEIILFEDQFDGQWYATDWGWLPNGWEGWWFDNKNRPPDKGWLEHRPEYGYPDPNHANADKQILTPPRTLQYGKRWCTVHAGVVRTYTVPIDKVIEIGMMGFVLGGGDHHDDPTRPGKMWDMVGIDPTAGHDGLAPSVEWGEPLENLVRGFDSDPNWMLYTARARSVTDKVSVFTHFHPEWPMEHLGPLFDDFYLAVIDDEEPPPDGIDRTYWLMNPLADASNSCAVVNGQWPYRRAVQGGSADEAKIGVASGLVKHNRCFILNPEEWAGDIDEYIGPETEKIHIEYTNNFQLEGRVLAYSLVDIGVSLLFPSTNEQQHVTQEFGRANVVSGGRIIHHNGLDIRSSWNVWGDELLAALPGKVIIAGYNSAEPWYGQQVRISTPLPNDEVMLTRYAHLTDGDEYVQVGNVVTQGQKIGKPDDTGQSTADHLHFDVAVQGHSGVKYADPQILIDWGELPEPPEPPGPIAMPQYIAPHAQTRHHEDGLREFLTAQDDVRGIKFFHPQDCEWAWNVSKTIGRENDVWFQYRKFFGTQDLSSPTQVAKYICDAYEGDIIRYGDYITAIEPFNEIMDSSIEGVLKAVAIDVECMLEVERRRWPVVLCGHTAGVGNPHESQYPLLLPLAQVAHEGGHALGLHSYGGEGRNESYLVSDAAYHAMRYVGQDEVFTKHGYFVKWFLSEAGPIGAGPRADSGYLPLYWEQGWRHPNCMDGDWLRCFEFLSLYSKMIHEWNRKHNMRVIAYSPFTTGAPWLGWDWFQFKNEQLVYLAHHR